MFRWLPLFSLILLLLPIPAHADDYYLIEMNTPGQRVGACQVLFWDADTVFYNTTSQNEVVTLAGVSNGDVVTFLPLSLNVAPGRATSLRQSLGVPWAPGSLAPMWIIHVNAPPSILVDSEMIPGLTTGGCRGPLLFSQQNGATRLPVFRSLVPANQRQLIGGLTIGDVAGHINVAVYNAGPDTASATIELHRACDGAIMEARNVTVGANTAQQFTGFEIPDGTNVCAPLDPSATTRRLAYVVVTVDQPSLTFASILGPVSEADNQPYSTIQVSPGIAR